MRSDGLGNEEIGYFYSDGFLVVGYGFPSLGFVVDILEDWYRAA